MTDDTPDTTVPDRQPPVTRELREAASGELARRVSTRFLEQHCLLPLRVDQDGSLLVAVGAAVDDTLFDELCWAYSRPVRFIEAPAAEIQAAIMSVSGSSVASGDGVDSLRGADLEVVAQEEEPFDDISALANEPPVIKLVNVMILEALKARASDLHLESTGEGLRVRHRVDGVLHDVSRPPRTYQAAVISRIKIMADLNIAERRLPQDGRIRLKLAEREVDLRVSTMPSLHGESVVLRILDRGVEVPALGDLGMSQEVRDQFQHLIRRSHGLVLVTGPTGSGKSTTLYAALRSINAPGAKILTIEDPIEYQLEGVTQIPVNRKAGLGFANALRSILRHDPDIIMVGEMRDPETAEIAIQSALTGHLVFSTLHTNDAPSGLTRLIDMGIEPYLVAATVEGIVAQRLVRQVCANCAEPYDLVSEELLRFPASVRDATDATFRRGHGCDACSNTGFRGRTGLFELMVMSDAMRDLVVHGASLSAVRRLGASQGMDSLLIDGYRKAAAGVTSPAEVLRVTSEEVTS